MYAATDIKISYNKDFYESVIFVNDNIATLDTEYTLTPNGSYEIITLLAVLPQNAGDTGLCRKFEVQMRLKGDTLRADRNSITLRAGPLFC